MHRIEMQPEVRGINCFKQFVLESLHRITDSTMDHIPTSNNQVDDSLHESEDAIHDCLSAQGLYLLGFTWDIKLGVSDRAQTDYQ